MNESPSFFIILSRALSSKCPVCGQGQLFAKLHQIQNSTHFFIPLEVCNNCKFQFGRQPGYYFGVITPILPILALATGAFSAGIIYFVFKQKVETVLRWAGAGTLVGFLLFFRTAVAIYIALDHAIDPPNKEGNS
jgi:uncharacterized protein (DUF983 family)